MTYEEALHEISTKVYRNTDDFEMTISKDCYKKIIDALEKQIPKKLDLDGGVYCPCCLHEFKANYDTTSYCPNCGQAIDWGDTE